MSNKYLEVATSKDSTRPNLTSVYRGIDSFYGCDGHRLHWIDGQDKIEKGFYLDGKDHGEYPDCKLPSESAKMQFAFDIRLTKEDIQKLKAMAKLVKIFSPVDLATKLIVSDLNLRFEYSNDRHNVSVKLSFPCIIDDGTEGKHFESVFNLQYIIDALELPAKECKNYLGAKIRVEYCGELKPIVFVTDLGNAMIMPVRL